MRQNESEGQWVNRTVRQPLTRWALGGRIKLYLAFATKDLREICEHEDIATATLGSKLTELLHTRLADLSAAKSPRDLPGLPPTSPCDHRNLMSLDLESGYQIRFVANHTNMPTNEGGDVAWERVSRIMIVGVQRYND